MSTQQQEEQIAASNDLYSDDFTQVTVSRNRRNKGVDGRSALSYITLGVAVIAIIVGAVAISKVEENKQQQDKDKEQNNVNLATQKKAAELSNGASTILSTVPFCQASPQNRQACVNLIAAGEKVISDMANASIPMSEILAKSTTTKSYVGDAKVAGISQLSDAPGSQTDAAAVITDENGHVLDKDGNPMKDAHGNIIESPLFDIDKCLFTYKNQLCFGLVPVGKTVEAERKRRSSGKDDKFDISEGEYVPVLHIAEDGTFESDSDGRMRRGGGQRSAAIMGCLSGMGTGAGAGGAMGAAVGTIVPGFGTAIAGAAGSLIGGAVGCGAGAGWFGRR